MYVFSSVHILLSRESHHVLTSYIDDSDGFFDGICCPRTDYAYCNIVEHSSKAEPSADLREALLNTRYITSLIKFEQTISNFWDICYFLLEFLSFLKCSVGYVCLTITPLFPDFLFQKFTDTEELYLHHRNIYDSIIRERISNFPLDFGFTVFMVFIKMKARVGKELPVGFMDYFPPTEGGIASHYLTLSFCPTEDASDFLDSSCCVLLGEFFTDPVRAGNYFLDGAKYALVAGFLLDCFIKPCPEREFLEQVVFVF